jgi:NAD(P)-dependent dehydrogenase (short-subunit alcohol dehydrogenase family)
MGLSYLMPNSKSIFRSKKRGGGTLKTLLVEPEFQSIIFLLVNSLVFIYVLIFVVAWPYTLFYLVVHLAFFFVVNNHLSTGRLYIPTKNLKNQTVIVTGAASGIGRVTALELAKLQARVIVGIRGQARAERVARELSKESHGNVIGHHLDLSDLSSVKEFAAKINKIDILINNAGVTNKRKELTKDGLESTFGTNHSKINSHNNLFYSFYLVGHFYLTELLLRLLIQSNGRIINVSSVMHIFTSENIDFSKRNSYKPLVAYAESKLANILHAVELQRRFGDRGIKVYSLHPGSIPSTELSRDKAPIQAAVMAFLGIISKTIAQGAMTTLYCAVSDEAQPGKYHSNCQVAQPSLVAYNSKKAQELWELSETIVNEKTKCL